MSADRIVSEFSLEIEQVEDFEFRVRFDKEHYEELIVDEPAPLGKDVAPSPARLLAASVGNCLAASFLFCARKAKVPVGNIRADVRTQIARNEAGRLRIASIQVTLNPTIQEEERERARRCVEIFEDYCTVTESVRDGIDVQVTVEPVTDAAKTAEVR